MSNWLLALYVLQPLGLTWGIMGLLSALKETRLMWWSLKICAAAFWFTCSIRSFIEWGIWMAR